ncbi:unnamed protein product [Dracunculus medinensis]|uniref:Uncharacterized protein n=1 Tax=Dracunculus medinensis TaxID=318479 RepID=A0A158Q3V3_DRAME|nr:unnamed protein product [Dracunculus medinensis]
MSGDECGESKDSNNITNNALLNWDSNVNNWEDCHNCAENRRGSTASSTEESPPSDIPTSSTSSSQHTSNVFKAFIEAIDKNEINERPDLETQLKIMNWICSGAKKLVRF